MTTLDDLIITRIKERYPGFDHMPPARKEKLRKNMHWTIRHEWTVTHAHIVDHFIEFGEPHCLGAYKRRDDNPIVHTPE